MGNRSGYIRNCSLAHGTRKDRSGNPGAEPGAWIARQSPVAIGPHILPGESTAVSADYVQRGRACIEAAD